MTLLLFYFAFEVAVGAILGTVIAFGLNHRDYLLGPTQRAEQARKDRQLGARIFLARRTADNWTEKVREDAEVCRVRIEFRFDCEFEEIPF